MSLHGCSQKVDASLVRQTRQNVGLAKGVARCTYLPEVICNEVRETVGIGAYGRIQKFSL